MALERNVAAAQSANAKISTVRSRLPLVACSFSL